MPISNPSYFPDQRGNGAVIGITAGKNAITRRAFLALSNAGNNATVSDLIVIGDGAAAGGITDPTLNGSTFIGTDAGATVTVGSTGAAPLTVIGANSLKQFTQPIDSIVIVGSQILNGVSSGVATRSVYVGNILFPGAVNHLIGGAVVIGYNIGVGASAAPFTNQQNCQFIGSNLFPNTANSTYSGVVIGNDIECIASTGDVFGPNVILGSALVLSGGPVGNVIIGDTTVFNGPGNAAAVGNVILGSGISYSGNANVAIGPSATVPALTGNVSLGNVLIGASAGLTIPSGNVALNSLLHLASTANPASNTPSGLLFGSFKFGNLVLGNMDPAVDQGLLFDGTATNIAKLLNGTKGAANPTAGGYFYVTAGALHWVGSGGTDTALAPA